MKTKLSYKELHKQLMYNPWTGFLYWKVSNSNRIKIGNIAGYKRKDGYIQIRIDTKLYLAHRLIWFYVKGYFPEYGVDHNNQITHHN